MPDPIPALDREADEIRAYDQLRDWWRQYIATCFAIRNERITEMLLPEERCKRCNERPPGPSGLCAECEKQLHSSDEADNYNGWTLTSADEYRETGE